LISQVSSTVMLKVLFSSWLCGAPAHVKNSARACAQHRAGRLKTS
jgi:hypothetical protein